MLTQCLEHQLDVSRDRARTGDIGHCSSSLHQNLELRIFDNTQGSIALGAPSCNVGTTNESDNIRGLNTHVQHETHCDSALVWARWETLTGCWPCLAKAAKIKVSQPLDWVLLKAESTVSCPKHLIAWLWRFDVAMWSFKSWKHWTPPLPLHFLAAHRK